MPCGPFDFQDTRVAFLSLKPASERRSVDHLNIKRGVVESVEPDIAANKDQSKRAKEVELDLLKTRRDACKEPDIGNFTGNGISVKRLNKDVERLLREKTHLNQARLIFGAFRMKERRFLIFFNQNILLELTDFLHVMRPL